MDWSAPRWRRVISSVGDTSDRLDCTLQRLQRSPLNPMKRPHLGNKVVSKEDVGGSSQHGVRGSILHLGFEETVRRVTRNSHVAKLWFEVYDGHCYLKVKVMIGMMRRR